MNHYLFTDHETCEDFLVGADTLAEAEEIARENFVKPHFICRYTDWQAEMSGLDEY